MRYERSIGRVIVSAADKPILQVASFGAAILANVTAFYAYGVEYCLQLALGAVQQWTPSVFCRHFRTAIGSILDAYDLGRAHPLAKRSRE